MLKICDVNGMSKLFIVVFDGIVLFVDGEMFYYCLLLSCYLYVILIVMLCDLLISDV